MLALRASPEQRDFAEKGWGIQIADMNRSAVGGLGHHRDRAMAQNMKKISDLALMHQHLAVAELAKPDVGPQHLELLVSEPIEKVNLVQLRNQS
jgi:hypothetical protein